MNSSNDTNSPVSTIEAQQDVDEKRQKEVNKSESTKKEAEDRKQTADSYNKASEEAKKDEEEKNQQRLRENNAREFMAMLEADPEKHHYIKPEIVDRFDDYEDLSPDASIQDASKSLADTQLIKNAHVVIDDPDFKKKFKFELTENGVTSLTAPKNMAEFERISEHLLNIAGGMKGFTGSVTFDIDKPEFITPEKIKTFLDLAAKKGIEVEFGPNIQEFLNSKRATTDPFKNQYRDPLTGKYEPGKSYELTDDAQIKRMKDINQARVAAKEKAAEVRGEHQQDPIIQSRVNDVADEKKISLDAVPEISRTTGDRDKEIAKYTNMNPAEYVSAAKNELDKIEKSLKNVEDSLSRLETQATQLKTQLDQKPGDVAEATAVQRTIEKTATERDKLVSALEKELDQLRMHTEVIKTAANKVASLNPDNAEIKALQSRAQGLESRFARIDPENAPKGQTLVGTLDSIKATKDKADTTIQADQTQTASKRGPGNT